MSCCNATHIRRLNRLTGGIEVIDLATNVALDPVVDAALIASLVACPTREVISEKVCVQPIGNTDPSLIEQNAKCLQTVEIAADGTTAVLSSILLLSDGSDVTATHEVVACPVNDVIDVPVCLPS